jgi:hypothetical protein
MSTVFVACTCCADSSTSFSGRGPSPSSPGRSTLHTPDPSCRPPLVLYEFTVVKVAQLNLWMKRHGESGDPHVAPLTKPCMQWSDSTRMGSMQ